MRGYTGEIYDGYPVFIRSEYEEENADRSELDRLNDLSDYTGSFFLNGLHDACMSLWAKDSPLIYTVFGERADDHFTGGFSNSDMWVSHPRGIIHKVTRELRTDICDRSPSRPSWMKRAWHFATPSEDSEMFVSSLFDIGAAIISLIAGLSDPEEEDEEDFDDEEEEDFFDENGLYID